MHQSAAKVQESQDERWEKELVMLVVLPPAISDDEETL